MICHAERINIYSDCIKVRDLQWVEKRMSWSSCLSCRFLWWMWQPVCYLMSFCHGWQIVVERIILFYVVDTAPRHILDLICADSLSRCCCYNKPWVYKLGNKDLEENTYGVLHLVAICTTLFIRSLKCHLGIKPKKKKILYIHFKQCPLPFRPCFNDTFFEWNHRFSSAIWPFIYTTPLILSKTKRFWIQASK